MRINHSLVFLQQVLDLAPYDALQEDLLVEHRISRQNKLINEFVLVEQLEGLIIRVGVLRSQLNVQVLKVILEIEVLDWTVLSSQEKEGFLLENLLGDFVQQSIEVSEDLVEAGDFLSVAQFEVFGNDFDFQHRHSFLQVVPKQEIEGNFGEFFTGRHQFEGNCVVLAYLLFVVGKQSSYVVRS